MAHSHRRDLVTDINVQLTKISHPYQCRKSQLSYGRWNSSMNMIEIIHQHRSAAKSFLSMGITKNSKLYLYPEEAMFLIQCSLLQIVRNDHHQIPISLDEIYSLWFNQISFQLEHLHVYQYLTRIGFILLRHQSNAIRNDEQNDLSIPKISNERKRKRDESERELIPSTTNDPMEEPPCICSIHASIDCQRQWFPSYTNEPPVDVKQYPRLVFPDRFMPVHIDWIPKEFNEKVSRVELTIYESRTYRPRPSYSLIRPEDLQSHSTVYQRLSSFSPRIKPPNPVKSSAIFFDMYTPRKHFRKSQPGPPDYYLEIKRANDEFSFDEIYNTQQTNKLIAVVHNGDSSFFTFKSFDPLVALQSK